jgi:hypothetical protein
MFKPFVSADILFNSSMRTLLLCNIYGIYDVNCYHCITLYLAMIICRLSLVVYKSSCSSSLLFLKLILYILWSLLLLYVI